MKKNGRYLRSHKSKKHKNKKHKNSAKQPQSKPKRCKDYSKCPVDIRLNDAITNIGVKYEMYCTKCGFHIKWASEAEYDVVMAEKHHIDFRQYLCATPRWINFKDKMLNKYPSSLLNSIDDVVELTPLWQELWQQHWQKDFDQSWVYYDQALHKHLECFDLEEILLKYAQQGNSTATEVLDLVKKQRIGTYRC